MHLTKNHLTHSLSTGICIVHRPGPGKPGKRSPCSCNSHWLMSLASSWQYASCLLPLHGGHSILSELLNPFPIIRAIGAAQIFYLEFGNDGSADLGDIFADGGANQPVILQGGVGLSRCLSVIANFSPTSNGFLKMVTDFLMRWCMRSSMRFWLWWWQ